MHEAVTNVDRLAEIEAAGLADAGPEEPFDRITRLAERILDVPVALISIVSGDRQLFKSQVGLSGTWEAERQSPLTHSFCQYAVADKSRFVVDDARANARVADNPAVDEQGVVAYAGEPLRTARGHVLGTVCVIDHEPREWSDWELELLTELAALTVNEIEYRLRARALRDVEATAHALQVPLAELGSTVRSLAAIAESVEDHRVGRLASLARSHLGALELAAGDLRSTLLAESGKPEAVHTLARLAQPILRSARVATASFPDKDIKVEMLDRPLVVTCDVYNLERGLTEVLIALMHHATGDAPIMLTGSREDDTARIAIECAGATMPVAELGRTAALLNRSTCGPDAGDTTDSSITTGAGATAVRHGNVQAVTGGGTTTVVARLPLVHVESPD